MITTRRLVNFSLCCRVTLTSQIWPFLSVPKPTSCFRFFTQTLAMVPYRIPPLTLVLVAEVILPKLGPGFIT